MWERDCVEHHERLIVMLAKPSKHVILNDLLGVSFTDAFSVVARQQEGLLVVVQIGREVRVGVSLAVVAKEMIDALVGWAAG